MKFKSYLRNTKDFPPSDENPFLEFLVLTGKVKRDFIKTWIKNEADFVNTDTGEFHPGITGLITQEVEYDDNRSFRKIYLDGLILLNLLNNYELKVYIFIMSSLPQDTDIFHFSMYDCKRICNYKNDSVVNTALTGLLEKKLIHRAYKKDFFWINPMFCFNGKTKECLSKHRKSKLKKHSKPTVSTPIPIPKVKEKVEKQPIIAELPKSEWDELF